MGEKLDKAKQRLADPTHKSIDHTRLDVRSVLLIAVLEDIETALLKIAERTNRG